MGIFSTESELLLNDTLRCGFRTVKLIGEEYDPESLQNYSNQVMNIFVNNQLVFFSNGQGMIDDFIVQAVDLLDSVVINKYINISEMSTVQLLAPLLEHDKVFEKFKK